jgi:hypothetical protein
VKYGVYSVHRWSGIQSDRDTVEASSPRQAAAKFARRFGSLGMLNYVRRLTTWSDGATVFEVMGTSGMVLDVTVSKD